MKFHVMTLFPDLIRQISAASILKRAALNGLISIEAYDIREYSADKHRRADDYPYGGGAGMVMSPDPVVRCYEAVQEKSRAKKVIYLTPQGRVFSQAYAKELSKEEELILLCGHYEGIDERALQMVVTDAVSIGDYVLTGGELPAMVLIDAVARLLPGVLHNASSAEFESFSEPLLEYPQYTRPEAYRGRKVPEVLLSGHHEKIALWRREQALLRTMEMRPDLLEKPAPRKKEAEFYQNSTKDFGVS